MTGDHKCRAPVVVAQIETSSRLRIGNCCGGPFGVSVEDIRKQPQFSGPYKGVEFAVVVVANADIIAVAVSIGGVSRKRREACKFRTGKDVTAYLVDFIAVYMTVSSDAETGRGQIGREQTAAPVGVPCFFGSDPGTVGGEPVVVIVDVELECPAQFPQIVDALGGLGPGSCLLQGGQQHSSENGDDGNNNQKFDQSEGRGFTLFIAVKIQKLSKRKVFLLHVYQSPDFQMSKTEPT